MKVNFFMDNLEGERKVGVVRRAFAVGWVALALLFAPRLARGQAAELFDPAFNASNPTQCFGMHCCPSGYAMRGARVDDNRFLCRRVTNQSSEDCFTDVTTNRGGMHACPTGTYMRGAHVRSNVLTCCYDRGVGFTSFTPGGEIVDANGAHQEAGMHACANRDGGTYMTGIHVDHNNFLCASVPATLPPHAIVVPTSYHQDPEQRRSFVWSAGMPVGPDGPFAVWQRATRNWLARIMDLPITYARTPAPGYVADPTSNEMVSTRHGIVRRQKIRYRSPIDGQLIPAYLLFPPDYNPSRLYPAVLHIHGHWSDYKDGSAKEWFSRIQDAGALHMAENGFIALAPDSRSFGEYLGTQDYGDAGHGPYTDARPAGLLQRMYLADNVTNVSLLESIPGVDRSQLAVAGVSLGGWEALWIAALDERVKAAIVGGNFITLACLNNAQVAHKCQGTPALSLDPFNPSTRLLIDTPDIAALVAPRRLMAMWGDLDATTIPMADCRRDARAGAERLFAEVGAGASFRYLSVPGMPHEYANAAAFEFLTGRRSALQVDYGTYATIGSPPTNPVYGTTCNGMHCCPPGSAMVGMQGRSPVNDPYNTNMRLVCRSLGANDPGGCIVDRGTQRAGMHACPPGMYMRGVDVPRNQITCCASPVSGEQLDTNTTQEQGMHVCADPENHVMTGIRADRDQYLCAAR